MKKRFIVFLIGCLFAFSLTSCGKNVAEQTAAPVEQDNAERKATVEWTETVEQTNDKQETPEQSFDEERVSKDSDDTGDTKSLEIETTKIDVKSISCDGTDDKTIQFYEIQEGTKYINQFAFEGCCDLVDISIPNTVIEISKNAFTSCSSIKEISLPEGLKIIGDCAFSGCAGLENTSLPSTLERIGRNAFDNSSLTKAVVPKSVKELGEGAFTMSKNLTDAEILSDNITELSNTFECCEGLQSVKLTDSINHIGMGTFRDCISLERINMPANLKVIDGYAFYGDKNLTEIVLPDSIEHIGEYAFDYCTKLTVTLPDSTITIDTGAFEYCKCVRVPKALLNSLGVYEDGFQTNYARDAKIEVIE